MFYEKLVTLLPESILPKPNIDSTASISKAASHKLRFLVKIIRRHATFTGTKWDVLLPVEIGYSAQTRKRSEYNIHFDKLASLQRHVNVECHGSSSTFEVCLQTWVFKLVVKWRRLQLRRCYGINNIWSATSLCKLCVQYILWWH